MPWEKVYNEMEQLPGSFFHYNWSLRITTIANLWRDKKGKVYAAAPISTIPSDAPFKTGYTKPIYFEELTPEKAGKLIRELKIEMNA